jgi:mevalonate kinase
MKKCTASAPGKLLLFGDHAVVYGYPCIVTAIDQRVFVSVEERDDDLFVFTGQEKYQKKLSEVGQGEVPKDVQFLEAVLAQFLKDYPQKNGVTISTKSDFSSLYGFGSSSAVSVACAKALAALYLVDFTQQQLFELAYQSILDVQKVGSGFDAAAAVWGGTIYYVKPAKIVEQILIKELPLVVGYTGIKVSTSAIVQEVAQAKEKDPQRIERLFQRSTDIVEEAKIKIAASDWTALGHVMNQNQIMLAELGVSSPELYRLIEAAKKAGAMGAKLSGAGKGDCMIALANQEKKKEVEEAINAAKGQVISVQTGAEGVRIET